MNEAQLAMKNIDSGHYTIVKTITGRKVLYTDYILMFKGLFIYEIKYETNGNTPQ